MKTITINSAKQLLREGEHDSIEGVKTYLDRNPTFVYYVRYNKLVFNYKLVNIHK